MKWLSHHSAFLVCPRRIGMKIVIMRIDLVDTCIVCVSANPDLHPLL